MGRRICVLYLAKSLFSNFVEDLFNGLAHSALDIPVEIVEHNAYSDDVEQVAIPVRKSADTATLLAAINQALAELDADGTLTELSVKYFGTDISKMS